VIRQQNSWSQLQISYTGFLRLISCLDASAAFTNYVRAFGFKTCNKDENIGGYHRRARKYPSREGTDYGILNLRPCCATLTRNLTATELCFNIRYPAYVSRDGEYPWVLRHTAVYQNCNLGSSASDWILLQPPQTFERKVASILDNPKSGVQNLDCECEVLFMILAVTEMNWRPYINYLESEINEFVSSLPAEGVL
jgi:hypothetical protein